MKQQKIESLTDILHTVQEALEHLKQTDNEELQQSLSAGRAVVTKELETELGCSLEQRVNISQLSDEEWLYNALHILKELSTPFQPLNTFDLEFFSLIKHLWSKSEVEIFQSAKLYTQRLKDSSSEIYHKFVDYFSRFPLWGSFSPEENDWTTLELRAAVLKRHSYDFLWLYRRLEDYLSKRTLTAILRNWAFLDTDYPQIVKSVFPDYWEPDIFSNNHNDVLVDVGAYVGDSIANYLNTYGTGFRKIYAYEISPDSYNILCSNIKKWNLPNIIPRQKGVGAEHGEAFLHLNSDASANKLQKNGEGQRTEIVTLDDDAPDATFIKMDIEGAEQNALLGSQNLIREKHPKLAICIYHGYEDIWKIPSMIDELNPDYRFYLRHNGGNLIPTEFVLLCKPQ